MPKSTSLLKGALVVAIHLLVVLVGIHPAVAQTQPAPAIHWVSDYTHNDERSESGLYHTFQWNATEWTATPLPVVDQHYGEPQDREDSGEEWHFGHSNYSENGTVVGYITAGYASWPNCYWTGSGCTPTINDQINDPTDWTPDPGEFEMPDHRKGETRCEAARMDINGHEVWYRHLLPGVAYNAIEDSEGNIIVVGQVYNNVYPDDMDPMDQTVIRWNDDTQTDINDIDCSTLINGHLSRTAFVSKLSPTGLLLWTTLVTAESQLYGGSDHRSLLHDVVAVPGPNGPEYVVVGMSTTDNDLDYNPFLARLSNGGTVMTTRSYSLPEMPTLPSTWPVSISSDIGWFTSIALDETTLKAFISGWYLNGTYYQTVGLQIDLSNAAPTYLPDWFHASGDGSDPVVAAMGLVSNVHNYSSGGGYVNTPGGPRVVWPTLVNYSFGDIFSGRKEAELTVHALLDNGTLDWTTSLGTVRAYDLQADMTATSDGNVALVCSKWASTGTNTQFDDTYLGATLGCIQQDFDYVPDGDATLNVDWTDNPDYDYWNTDAFVAKLSIADGAMLWCAQWDADPTTTFECWPGDIRNQECMYKITEAPDGGLVVSGNTSHNFDDYYLVKLQGCQANLEYAALPLNSAGEHHITGSVTWNTNMRVFGIIVVDPGATLTIDGAIIEFADSRQSLSPTGLFVEPGGHLILEDNAVLTSITQCPGSMWDGIVLKGDATRSQLPANNPPQAWLESGEVMIENARIAVSVANAFQPVVTMVNYQVLASGGVVYAKRTTFRNNHRDAIFSPYENFLPGDPSHILANRSFFLDCAFETTAAMQQPNTFPADHATLFRVRGVRFTQCTFQNQGPFATWPDGELPSNTQLGTGIHSLSSSFMVAGKCTVIQLPGQPCPPANILPSEFINLHVGVRASTFDLSRTFAVADADFQRCFAGVDMRGIMDASIIRCDFDVAEPPTPDILGTPYGLYAEQCTGYRIQENNFNTTVPLGYRKVGLVIKDSGPYYNTFYNNTFENLHSGSIIEGTNASDDEVVGLEVKCNDYGLIDPNMFDVALTGDMVRIQMMQGQPLDQQDPSTYGNPAGNRFSVDHTGAGDPEEDWHVQNTATVVEYFHHTPTPGSRTKPEFSNAPAEVIPTDQNAFWPNKEVACPSLLDDGGKEVKRLLAEGEHEEYESSKDSYDATKDDGDTYTLLGYVSDPTKSSSQVRNALQSVAPKVSPEVWQAAFERNPPMSAWHITQALLSNSPLQSNPLLMVDDYGLPTGYASMVHAAQNGLNVLTLLESAMAQHGGNKAEALHDLGRMSWLDSLDLDNALDSLLLLHDSIPADNHALAVGGVLTAKGDYSSLEALALAEESASDFPERYTLLKHYAQLEQQSGWAEPDEALRTWLSNLSQQRDMPGSAWANAWLHALGEQLPEEVIVLPETGPKSASRVHHMQPVQWPATEVLEVFPNPAQNLAYVVYESASEAGVGDLRLLDLHGRILRSQGIVTGQGITQVDLTGLGSGIYLLDLLIDGAPTAQTKLVVQ